MTPTLMGRLQTRLLVTLGVGLPWTVVISPILFLAAAGSASFSVVLGTSVLAILLTAVLGALVWEPIYHACQQFRWEKDWPTGLGLLTILNEGFVVVTVLVSLRSISPFAFFLHFASTWVLIWFILNGPLRVLLPRWRFRGGQFL